MDKKLFATILSCILLITMTSCAVSPVAESMPPAQEETQTPPPEETSAPATEPAVPEQIDTESYSIFWEDDRCYMKFHDTKETKNPTESAIVSAHYPEFSSVKEMKQALLTGDLLPEEIAELRRYADDKTNIVEICNIETFYDATFPAGYTIDYIQFSGRGYCFNLTSDEGHGLIFYVNEEDYANEYRNIYEGEGRAKGIEVISNETSADGKKAIFSYRFNGNTFKQIRYSIPTAYGQLDVLEKYQLAEKSGSVTESFTSFEFFGVNSGAHFHGWITALEKPPAEEWISSFGLREYVETEVA